MSAEAPLILSVFATFATGGPQIRFARIANHYGRRWRHAVVAMDGKLDCRESLSPALDVEFPEIAMRKGDMLGNAHRFRRVLRMMRPAALVTSNWGSIEWAIANLHPLARHVHIEDGFGPEESTGQLSRRVQMRRLVLRRATVVLPSWVLFGIARDVWRLPPERLRYVANGLDLRRFRPDGLPTAPPMRQVPVVGTVATLRPEKNLGRLLRAAALLLRDGVALRLVLIGDGPERTQLEETARVLGIASQVQFAGHAPDPVAAYRAMDVFALSSDTEQMPFAVLEAMASGLPIVATDVGDLRVMLAQENLGQLVACNDAAFAAALRRLVADAALRRQLGGANRAKAERHYDEAQMFESYAALFEGRVPAWGWREAGAR